MARTIVRILSALSLASLLHACGGGGSSPPPPPPPPPPTFAIGGSVTGLVGSVVLQNNGGDDLTVSADGSFSFATRIRGSTDYAVTILTQPSGQVCVVSDGSGTVGSTNVTSVAIQCAPAPPALSINGREVKTLRFTWGDVAGETEYRLFEERTTGAGFSLRGVLGADSEQADIEIFVPDFVDARYRVQACYSGGCVDSNIVEARPALDAAIGYGKSLSPDPDDGLAQQLSPSGAIIGSVALSSDGSTIVVGMPGDDSAATGVDGDATDNSAVDSGAVIVYARIAPTAWVFQAYIKSSNSEAGDLFGSSVSLSGDGSLLAISAPAEDGGSSNINGDQADNSLPESGAVYLFSRDMDGMWTQTDYIKASNPDSGDNFGHTLALADDGLSLLVGAPEEGSAATGVNGSQLDNSRTSSGAAYVLTQDGAGSWSHHSYLKASNTDLGDRFGHSVTIDNDGNTIAIGAKDEDGAATGVNGDDTLNGISGSGAAYVFEQDGIGDWSQTAYIKTNNPDDSDIFGWSVSLSGDGLTLATGAPNESSSATGINGNEADNSSSFSGAVFIHTSDGAGNWVQDAYIKASNSDASDVFAVEVDMNDDGLAMVVGAYLEDSSATGIDGSQADNLASASGAAYLFWKDSLGTWSQRSYIKAPNSEAGDLFGTGTQLSGDAQTLVIGAPGEDSASTSGGDRTDNSASNTGAVYIF